MPRDTSNKINKERRTKNAAATGLKTGNLKVKGENFYRDAKKVRRVNLLNGKSVRAIRDVNGKLLKAAEFQSSDVTPGRVQPDRRWFGNTRVISQTAMEHFRTSLENKVNDPYAVVLKQNKLPLSLLQDAVVRAPEESHAQLVTTEPFSDTFGQKAQRKRPKLDVGSFEELASAVSHEDTLEKANEELREKKQTAAEDVLGDAASDWILGAGTSKRIWAELYKVIDSSDIILHVLDARDPEGTICKSVEEYLLKEKKTKKIIYILNKVDLVPGWVAERWVKVLSAKHPTIAFHASVNNSFGKGSLITLLRQFGTLMSDKKQIAVGFIGYPNVGKSSIINTLKKKVVCKTAPIPGETKVWQYITLTRRIYLIDCPGIVPPSASDSDSDKVLKGTVRVEHLSQPQDHIDSLLERVKPEYIARTYGIAKWDDAETLLIQLAVKTGKLHRGGEPDLRTVATMMLNDWIRGKIPFFVPPPAAPVPEGGHKPAPKPVTARKWGPTKDEMGNKVAFVPGVTQPLHQIVHSNKFLQEDAGNATKPTKAAKAEDGEAKDDASELGETGTDEISEWGGISGEDSEGESSFEEDSDSGEPDQGVAWDDLFAQAEEKLEGEFEDEESDSEGASEKTKEPVKVQAVEESDEENVKQAKEKRMTTNKKKASNFYTTANVKNKNRNKKSQKTETLKSKSRRRK